jgi:hypothetical protein
MKNCMFCGHGYSGKKRGKEHILSQDLLREFHLSKEPLVHSEFMAIDGNFSGGHITISSPTRSLTYSGFVAGHVCATCNNGWMNDLEVSVRPYLYPLMRGDMSVDSLSADQKNLLSCWYLKTGIVLCQSIEAPQFDVPRDHAKSLFQRGGKTIPEGVAIFASSSRASAFRWSLCPTWKIEDRGNVGKDRIVEQHASSYKVFFQLGRLFLLACHWPYESLRYTYENIGIVPLGGRALSAVVDLERGEHFKEDSNQFMMAIGVSLEKTLINPGAMREDANA